MKAARMFLDKLRGAELLSSVARVRAVLYGSLAATGKGHGSDSALMLGLAGYEPETVDPDEAPTVVSEICSKQQLLLDGQSQVAFHPREDIQFLRNEVLPLHPNGLRFRAYSSAGAEILSATYYSVGGGFVVADQAGEGVLATRTGNSSAALLFGAKSQASSHAATSSTRAIRPDATELPLPFKTANELLDHADRLSCSIAHVMRVNERHWRPDEQIDAGLLRIWKVMQGTECTSKCCWCTSASYPSSRSRCSPESAAVGLADTEFHPIVDRRLLALGQGVVVAVRPGVHDRVRHVEGPVRAG
jgi:L-serine dehydratase